MPLINKIYIKYLETKVKDYLLSIDFNEPKMDYDNMNIYIVPITKENIIFLNKYIQGKDKKALSKLRNKIAEDFNEKRST